MPKNKNNLNDQIDLLMNYLEQGQNYDRIFQEPASPKNATAESKPEQIADVKPKQIVENKPQPVAEAKRSQVIETKPLQTVEPKPTQAIEDKPLPVVESKPRQTFENRPEPLIQNAFQPVVENKAEPIVENDEPVKSTGPRPVAASGMQAEDVRTRDVQPNYLNVLSRRKWLIIITTMAVLIMVAVGLIVVSPTYEATAKIRIMTATSGGKDYVNYDVTYTERLMETYAEIAKSVPVTSELINQLNTTEDQLSTVSISIIPNTELLSIVAEDTDPLKAMQTSNTLANIMISKSKELISNSNAESVTLMEAAPLPTVPSKPNKPLFLMLGLLFGLVGGTGLAFAVESLDTLLYSMDQIEAIAKLPVLGDIPEYRYPLQAGDFIIGNTLHSEAFRRLRTNVFYSSKNKGDKVFLFTSAVKGDGKTTIVANLANSVAKTGRKVLVIDGDFRDPSLHKYFNAQNQIGLYDLLLGRISLEDAIMNTDYPGLDIIPGGSNPDDPAEILGRTSMQSLLKKVKSEYDIVLIDVTGSLSATDSTVMAPFVDGVLLVIRMNYVRRDALNETMKNLRNINANLLGIIINRTNRGVGTKFDKKTGNVNGYGTGNEVI